MYLFVFFMDFALKYTLSDMSIANPVFFSFPFAILSLSINSHFQELWSEFF